MNRKMLFFCILILSNSIIKTSHNFSKKELEEIGSTATGKSLSLHTLSGSCSAIGSPVKLTPVTSFENDLAAATSYGSNSLEIKKESSVIEKEKEPEFMFMSIICCCFPCFRLEFFNCEKKNCCYCCCCSDDARKRCFSFCCM